MSLSKFGNVSKNFRDVSKILRRTRIQVLLGFSDLIKDSCFHFSSTISIWGILHRSYCFLCSVIINIVHWGGEGVCCLTLFLDHLIIYQWWEIMWYILKFLISKIKIIIFQFIIWVYFGLPRGFIEFSYLMDTTIMPPVSRTEIKNTHSCPHSQWDNL